MPHLPCLRCWLLLGLSFIWCLPANAETPLHERIDQAIAGKSSDFEAKAASLASDAEFLRRVYLDLTGTIPSSTEVRTFLNDQAADKRRQLVDRLLASPECAHHLQNVFDVMFMERRPDKHVPRAQWQEFLRTSFGNNKPWDELAREILTADGEDAKLRPAAKFYLDREADVNVLTRDIGRLFLGTDLQCAQCHDHPVIEDYKQEHYYGLYAFLNRTFLFTDGTKKTLLAEKAEGEVSFQSVFDPAKITKTSGPRLLNTSPLKEPMFEKGKEYTVAPAKNVRPVPKFSRRAQLAPQLVNAGNPQFRRNIVNRLWALMMGRGLVHPVDLDHTANPASHPELLNLLGDQFAAMKFDIKAFLRELALTKTYQRSSEMPPAIKETAADSFAVAKLKPLSPEQLAFSLMQATGLTDVERKKLGKSANEQALHTKLAGNVAPFVTTFGSQPGQPEADFQATLDQVLFLANGKLVREWLVPREGNLTARLIAIQDPAALAEELYVSVLSRLPTDEERQEVAEFLKAESKDRTAFLGELAWALLASTEFRFNH